MKSLFPVFDQVRESYKVELHIQELLYTNEKTKQSDLLFSFDKLLSFDENSENESDLAYYQYFHDPKNEILLAYQLVQAMKYRSNNSKTLSQIAKLIIIKSETFQHSFSNMLFETITKYLKNEKVFPAINRYVFFLRRLFDEGLVKIEDIITFLMEISHENKLREIIFITFVLFAPEIEDINIDSYDILYNIVEDMSFAQTSDDEYQIDDEDETFVHPFRNFINDYSKFKENNWDLLKKCIENEANVNSISYELKKDNIEYLIDLYSNIHSFNINQKIMKSIFEPNDYLNHGCSLIEFCAYFGSMKCFKFLFLQHAIISYNFHLYSISGGQTEIIRIFEQNINKNKDDKGNTQGMKILFHNSLHLSALFHRNTIFQWIFDSFEDMSLFELSSEGKSVFEMAATSNNLELIINILEKGSPHINSVIDEINTAALVSSCENGCYETCKILLENKNIIKDINQNDFNANSIVSSPIHVALYNSHFHIVDLLLALRRNYLQLDRKDNNGNTPLHIAVILNNVDIVTKFLQNDSNQNIIDINCKNKVLISMKKLIGFIKITKEITPLLQAVKNCNIEIVKIFLDRNDIKLYDEYGVLT